MSNRVGFFNLSINNILSDDLSIIDQARIRLVYYGLLLAMMGILVILPNAFTQHDDIQLVSAYFLLGAFAILFKYFTYKPDFVFVSHALLIIGTFFELFSVFVTFQSINIIIIQLIILIILFTFYMLGTKWGTIYSLANLLPVLGYLIYSDFNNTLLSIKPEKIDGYTMIVGLFFNFILIMFIQGHFYAAFVKNIKELKDLADSEKQLNEKLEVAMVKSEKSSQVQSDFLSTMSHEIRTPLNAVIGMSNLLMMESPRPDQKENLEILRFSAGNLLTLINDVLDFNKIESGKIAFENIKFNLSELMNNICGGQMMKASEKGLNFQLHVDDFFKSRYVIGDPTRLSQILFNLVSNAIKFTTKGGVKVNVTCAQDRLNEVVVRFSIKDTGIGISDEKVNAIFEPFTQESITTTRQFGGTGLGLAIVKRLLELQGVNISLVSEVGAGSEFYFLMTLPVSSEVIVTEEPAARVLVTNMDRSDYRLANIQVLIAEDNPVNVMLMKKLFSKWGITPVIAENGERAIELFQYGNFDIILMDLQMPVMDGFQASKIIRKMPDPRKANVPIIALTASALFDIKDRVYEAGINDYVSKPFKPNELVEKMMTLVTPQEA
ncbi:response regulator [uncultured Mucilaginibacter sp.]|uniref:response regulator n=1 Tax=uncultured Mucilaginibacter sp. TaxID=797541 RepID=UPI0025F6AFFA|nr:response regulator [uncultured Mucilaginibacter sp.]